MDLTELLFNSHFTDDIGSGAVTNYPSALNFLANHQIEEYSTLSEAFLLVEKC